LEIRIFSKKLHTENQLSESASKVCVVVERDFWSWLLLCAVMELSVHQKWKSGGIRAAGAQKDLRLQKDLDISYFFGKFSLNLLETTVTELFQLQVEEIPSVYCCYDCKC
jgi:hypothetical protein